MDTIKTLLFTTAIFTFILVAMSASPMTQGMPIANQLSTFAFYTMQTLSELFRPISDLIRGY